MRGRSHGTLALVALAACTPDTVGAGDYGVVDDGGDALTVDPGAFGASSDPGPPPGSDDASAQGMVLGGGIYVSVTP